MQSRILRAQHEDDHWAAAVFKYLRSMADLQKSSGTDVLFVCMDDKAEVPIGERNHPRSTNVRSRPSLVMSTSANTAMDHDLTKSSMTPSVILISNIPETVDGSFYQG